MHDGVTRNHHPSRLWAGACLGFEGLNSGPVGSSRPSPAKGPRPMNLEAAHRILSSLHPTRGAEYPYNQSTLDLRCSLKQPDDIGHSPDGGACGQQLSRLRAQLDGQFVRHDLSRYEALCLEQFPHQFQGGPLRFFAIGQGDPEPPPHNPRRTTVVFPPLIETNTSSRYQRVSPGRCDLLSFLA